MIRLRLGSLRNTRLTTWSSGGSSWHFAKGSSLDKKQGRNMEILIPLVVTAFVVFYAIARFVAVCLDIYNKWPKRPTKQS